MYIHIGAFLLATLAVTLELASFLFLMYRYSTIFNKDKQSWWLNFLLIESEIYFVGTFLSIVPLLIILNSLIEKGIAEQKSDLDQINSPKNSS